MYNHSLSCACLPLEAFLVLICKLHLKSSLHPLTQRNMRRQKVKHQWWDIARSFEVKYVGLPQHCTYRPLLPSSGQLHHSSKLSWTVKLPVLLSEIPFYLPDRYLEQWGAQATCTWAAYLSSTTVNTVSGFWKMIWVILVEGPITVCSECLNTCKKKKRKRVKPGDPLAVQIQVRVIFWWDSLWDTESHSPADINSLYSTVFKIKFSG